jgi:hypothetical protein
MPRSSTLHGSAPDNSPFALLVLDLISDFDFEDVTSHQRVLFTAAAAYVREFNLVIRRDCVTAMEVRQTRAALDIFRTALKADTRPSSKVRLRSAR